MTPAKIRTVTFILPGSSGTVSEVLMGKPAARLTDMHTCPMATGVVPHVGGPISGPGRPTVLIGSMPAARRGDSTAHDGVIVLGCPTVLIG